MNVSIVRYMLGHVLRIEALLLILPFLVSLYYHEKEGRAFLITLCICMLLGILLTSKKPANTVFYLKEGCVITSLAWIFLSIFGCLPFVIGGDIPDFTDALFETISGFTTTGASILSDVESLSRTAIFWRSFTHWIGGMGVLVFLLAIIPLSGGYNINLMKAESPGPSVGKLGPKIRYTARILYIIYFALTIIQMILLLIGRMPLFDAVTTAFGTAGTGGFGIKNDSMAGYSAYIQWVVAIFMILFGINFNAYYFILMKQFKKAFSIEEVRCYIGIIFTATVIIFLNTYDKAMGALTTLRHSVFQVGSIITTTGFSTVDFDQWNANAKTVIVILMFIGACASSTGGGIKVSRFIITFKNFLKEMRTYIHPKSIQKIKLDGKPVEHDVIRSINVYFIVFTTVFTASVFLVSLENKSFATNFTAVAATINNIGPGLEAVGPAQNFGHFTNFTKYVLMFDMLAGRLELFPLLLLFHPALIKSAIPKREHKPKKEKEKDMID